MIRSKTQTNAGTRRSSYPKKSKDSYGKDSVRAGCCAKRNPVGTQLKKLLSCFGALDSLSCCVDGRGLTISFLFFQVLWPSAFKIQEWTESAGGQCRLNAASNTVSKYVRVGTGIPSSCADQILQ